MPHPQCRFGPRVALLVGAVLAPGLALAQSGTMRDVSPVSPPTLKAPVFDTATAAYHFRPLQQASQTVVAEVEGRPITLGEVADVINGLPPDQKTRDYEYLAAEIVDRLIRVQALVIAAQHQRLDEDPTIQRRIKAASDDIIATQFLRREAEKQVSETALLDRYQREYAGKPGPSEVRVRAMTLPTEAAARSILAQLVSGADFATLARKTGQDPIAANGGDLGYRTRSTLSPEIAGVAFATAPGQLVPLPISTEAGWVVAKVEDIRTQPTPSFAAVREALVAEAMVEKAPAIADAATHGSIIRHFGINGKEVQNLPSDRSASAN